jgi:hypothetical protein
VGLWWPTYPLPVLPSPPPSFWGSSGPQHPHTLFWWPLAGPSLSPDPTHSLAGSTPPHLTPRASFWPAGSRLCLAAAPGFLFFSSFGPHHTTPTGVFFSSFLPLAYCNVWGPSGPPLRTTILGPRPFPIIQMLPLAVSSCDVHVCNRESLR